jgi:hypothetical protein
MRATKQKNSRRSKRSKRQSAELRDEARAELREWLDGWHWVRSHLAGWAQLAANQDTPLATREWAIDATRWLEREALGLASETSKQAPIERLRALQGRWRAHDRQWAIAEAVANLWRSFDEHDPRQAPRSYDATHYDVRAVALGLQDMIDVVPPDAHHTLVNLVLRTEDKPNGADATERRVALMKQAARAQALACEALKLTRSQPGARERACATVAHVVGLSPDRVGKIYAKIRATQRQGTLLPRRE